jgi:hypothetical protein
LTSALGRERAIVLLCNMIVSPAVVVSDRP